MHSDHGGSAVLLRQDTYYNGYGIACMTDHIMNRLKAWRPSVFENYSSPLSGFYAIKHQVQSWDLALMASLDKDEWVKEPVLGMASGASHSNTQFYTNRRDIPSNTGQIDISHNPFALADIRLAIIGDSYINQNIASLSSYIKDILYIRGPFMQPEILDLFRPHALITSEAERYLDKPVENQFGSSYLLNAGIVDPGRTPNHKFHDAYLNQLSYRYRPSDYQAWSSRQNHRWQVGLSDIIQSDQIRVLVPEAPPLLEATGNDPKLLIRSPHGKAIPNPCYVYVSIFVSASCFSQLFYDVGEDFNETHSVVKSVEEGENELKFRIPLPCFRLRLDPLCSPGKFKIRSIILSNL